jgi:hypothetical protein
MLRKVLSTLAIVVLLISSFTPMRVSANPPPGLFSSKSISGMLSMTDNNNATGFTFNCTSCYLGSSGDTYLSGKAITGYYAYSDSSSIEIRVYDSLDTLIATYPTTQTAGLSYTNIATPLTNAAYVIAYNISAPGKTLYEVDFRGPIPPAMSTEAVSAITQITATANGTMSDFGTPTAVTAHGFVWATSTTPTLASSKVDLGARGSLGTFSGSLTGLSAGTTYYVRPYATNGGATEYGTETSFTTPAAPTVSTGSSSSITAGSAVGNGTISNLGSSSVTEHGHVWNTTTTLNTGLSTKTTLGTKATTGAFVSSITGLLPNTTYYVKSYSTNSAGTSYGAQSSFTTLPDTTPPAEVTNLTETHTSSTSTLNWTNPINADLNRVKVYRFNDSTSAWELIVP